MKNKNKMNEHKPLPHIGLRIIKSAIGVFICFVIDYFRGNSGIVFYSLLAVLWCIRDYVSETKKFALQRTVGTAIGAVYGLVVIVANGFLKENSDSANALLACAARFAENRLGYGFIISVIIIILIYTTVLLRQKQASYFSCVVFLSIVINHLSDTNPYLFVWNRFLDTMIGILVGVFVNCFQIYRNVDKDTLFLSGIDDTLLAPGGEISDYSKVELNRLIERGVKFTVSTIRTPASLLEPMRGIHLTLPVIAMDGAALYNIADNSFEKTYVIEKEKSIEIQKYLRSMGINYFTNVIVEDVLLIFYQDSDSEYYNGLIKKLRNSVYRNYLRHDGTVEHDAVYFMVIDETEKIEALRRQLEADETFREYKITQTEEYRMSGCSELKIYNRDARKENMIEYLKNKLNVSNTVTFGTVEGRYTHIIRNGEFNQVVNLIKASVKNPGK